MASTATWQSYLQPFEVKYGLPGGLLGALVRAESGGQVNAVSPVGAYGLGQLMPATAASLGVNPRDPIQNLRGAAMYLSQQMKAFGGDWRKALAAYNAGPGAVRKYGGIPPYQETQKYIQRVHDYWKESSRYGKGAMSGVLSPTQPTAGVAPVRKTVPGLDPGDVAKLQIAYTDEPTIGNALLQNRIDEQSKLDEQYGSSLQSFNANQARSMASQVGGVLNSNFAGGAYGPSKGGYWKTPNGWLQDRRQGELGYQFLQRLGNKGFGLRNDPGINQLWGGSHAAGSPHYDKRAVDWGNARNPVSLINQFHSWLKPRFDPLGLERIIWQAPGHYDHIDVATRT